MLIVKDIGFDIHKFKTIEEAESYLEAIDIENNEYEACDEDGNIYEFKLIKPPTAFKSGKFKIIKTNKIDKNLPKYYFMEYGKKFNKSTDELNSIYENSITLFEAFSKLRK